MKREEKGGGRHVVLSKYDFHDRLIKRQDHFGNWTHYQYDPLVCEVSQCDFPSTAALDGGHQEVRISSSFDAFGREISRTSANGNTTTYSYNVYGSTSKIFLPGGGQESFVYAKNGELISYIDPDGLITHYERDVLGRVIKKSFFSKEGVSLAEESFFYNGFHLVRELDKEGNQKEYFYDGAGRIIREEFCGRVTKFTYDPLGRLAVVFRYNGGDALVTHYKKDLEDRVIRETKTDLSGNILYLIKFSYDSDGNQESTTRFINGEKAIETFSYDSFGRKTAHRDALGFETRLFYDENYQNTLGQRVLQIKIIDPKNQVILKTQDALNRKERVERLGLKGQAVSGYEQIHDPHGNLILHKDHIYEEGQIQSTQSIRYEYTPDHWVKSLIRGYGTSDPRETHYSYAPSGKRIQKTLPDGLSLYYFYHPLGFLERLDSSDGKIAHSFTYNKHGDLLSVFDEIQKFSIRREVDPFGNVICEVFPHSVKVKKTYDDFSRPLLLNIEDQGQIRYNYDPLFLKSIVRMSKQGRSLYTHTFEKYDLDGNLIQEHLIGGLGQVIYKMDVRGQRTQISSPYFSQECHYDSVQNLVSSTIDRAESCYQYDEISQIVKEKTLLEKFHYNNDSLFNRKEKNGNPYDINDFNELLSDEEFSYEYDLRGNRVLKKSEHSQVVMRYDPLNQLIEVKREEQKIEFIYDPLGRRLAKIISIENKQGWKESSREYFLYDGNEEIGSFLVPGAFKNFRVLTTHSPPQTVSVEVKGKAFAALTDVQGNIRRLVNPRSKSLAVNYDYTAFGEKVQAEEKLYNPWQFASKRLDPNLGLIYFGKRDYDPRIGRWLTTDPAGFVDGTNLYQYLFNNPFLFHDLYGESATLTIPIIAFAIGGGPIAWSAIAAYAAVSIATGAAVYGGYKLYESKKNSYNQDDFLPGRCVQKTNLPENTGFSHVEEDAKKNHSSGSPKDSNNKNLRKIGKRKNFQPDPSAEGSHSVYKRNPKTGSITKYETYRLQTNPNNPKPWEIVKRYDGPPSDSHYNKVIYKYVDPPHVHDSACPGGVRPARALEIPK